MHILNYYLKIGGRGYTTPHTKPNNHKTNGRESDTSLLEYLYTSVICERDTPVIIFITYSIPILGFICLIEKEENATVTFIQFKKYCKCKQIKD